MGAAKAVTLILVILERFFGIGVFDPVATGGVQAGQQHASRQNHEDPANRLVLGTGQGRSQPIQQRPEDDRHRKAEQSGDQSGPFEAPALGDRDELDGDNISYLLEFIETSTRGICR